MSEEYNDTEMLGTALKSRAHRAYRALWNANRAYNQLTAVFNDMDMDLIHIDLDEGIRHIEAIHQALTNKPITDINSLEAGIEHAESYLPVHPDSVEGVHPHVEPLRELGLGVIREVTYIADGRLCPDDLNSIDRLSSRFHAIHSAAVTLIGCIEILSHAVNQGFQIDANEYCLRLAGDWE